MTPYRSSSVGAVPIPAAVPRRPVRERFWESVDASGDCWEWTGALTPRGYGLASHHDGGSMRVHRIAYELLVGPIPDGYVLDHLCRNRVCVNPAHLEPVTPAENGRRSPHPRRRTLRPFCARGHVLNEATTVRGSDGYRRCYECARAYWMARGPGRHAARDARRLEARIARRAARVSADRFSTPG